MLLGNGNADQEYQQALTGVDERHILQRILSGKI